MLFKNIEVALWETVNYQLKKDCFSESFASRLNSSFRGVSDKITENLAAKTEKKTSKLFCFWRNGEHKIQV